MDGSEEASGQWRDGKLHGRGKWTDTSGARYEGEFVDGQMSGLVTYTWADGRVYRGEWANGRRSGLGVMWNKGGGVQKCGRWVDGRFVGSCPVPCSKIPIGWRLSVQGLAQRRSATAAFRSSRSVFAESMCLRAAIHS